MLLRHQISRNFTLAILCLMSVGLFSWIIVQCGYGLDITDEGYYLSVIKDPSLHRKSVTNFGLIYNPIYSWLGESVFRLRVANVMILYLLAIVVCYFALPKAGKTDWFSKLERICLAIAFGCSIFMFFNLWILTPSYNSLNLTGFLFVCLALILLAFETTKSDILVALLLGLGGALVMLAKPSSAALLSVSSIVYLVFYKRFVSRRFKLFGFVITSVVTSLTVIALAAVLVDGSVNLFIMNLFDGLGAANKLLGEQLGLSKIVWRGQSVEKLPLVIHWAVVICVGVLALYYNYHISKSNSRDGLGIVVVLLLTLVAAILVVCVCLSLIDNPFNGFHRRSLFFLIWPFVISIVICAAAYNIRQSTDKKPRGTIGVTLGVLMIAYIAVFGTTNIYLGPLYLLSFFGVVASITSVRILVEEAQNRYGLYPLAIAVVVISAFSVQHGIDRPYRQVSWLGQQSSSVDALQNSPLGTLKFVGPFANYLDSVVLGSWKSGFEKGTPIIDLTGASPGVLYVLEGKPLGSYWLLGGYNNSASTIAQLLVSHDRAVLMSAWVLTENGGDRKIPASTLEALGIDLIDNYDKVASFTLPSGYGGRSEERTQLLYRPLIN